MPRPGIWAQVKARQGEDPAFLELSSLISHNSKKKEKSNREEGEREREKKKITAAKKDMTDSTDLAHSRALLALLTRD